MSKYTSKEIAVLLAFHKASVDSCGGCTAEENMSWSNARDISKATGFTEQSVGGIFASLLEKRAICDSGNSPQGLNINDFTLEDFEGVEKIIFTLDNIETLRAIKDGHDKINAPLEDRE